MLISYVLGQTSIILRVKIPNSTVTDNSGVSGLTNTTTGLLISAIADNEATTTAYSSAGSTIQGITTLGTYSAPTSGSCRFKEVDSTNHKGVYEIQLSNSRFSVSSSKSLLITVAAITASNTSQIDVLIPLTYYDPYNGMNLGLTAIPNANAAASGGLPTVGTGSGQINLTSGGVDLQTILSHAPTTTTNGILDVNVKNYNNHTAVTDGNNLPEVDVADWLGSAALALPTHFNNLAIDTSGRVILQPTGLDSITAWGGVTARQAVFYASATLFGEVSGLPTSPATVLGLDGSTTVAVITFDTNNNRSSITLTPP
jgi:hypothetical protein